MTRQQIRGSAVRFGRTGAGLAMLLATGMAAGVAIDRAQAEDLRSVVQRAVETHPEVGAIRADNRAVRHELRAERGAYLPSVDVRGSIGHAWINNSDTRNRPGRVNGEGPWIDTNRYEAGVSLRQLLFDGFGTDRRVESQIGRVKSASFRVKDTAQAIALRATEAYLEVLRTKHTVAIAQRNVRIHRQILSRVYARAKGGRGPRSDVDQARARLHLAESSLATARQRYDDAVALYIQAVGDRPDGKLEPATAPKGALPGNVDEAVNLALRQAPAIHAAAADAESAKAQIGVAKSEFFPKLELDLSYSLLRDVQFAKDDDLNFTALLVGTWNLYRGGIDTARTRAAKARLIEAREKLEQSRREVAQQVRNSWSALNAAKARQLAVRKELAANRRVRIAYARQFDRGQRTLLDLVDIQNEIFNNETALATEKYTILFGVYRTLAAMGRILEVMEIRLPIEAVKPPKRNLFQGIKDDLPKIGLSRKKK